jgi:hypothetical protein
MAKTDEILTIASAYNRTYSSPLDRSLLIPTLTDIDITIDKDIRYPGMIFFVEDENTYYYFDNDINTPKVLPFSLPSNGVFIAPRDQYQPDMPKNLENMLNYFHSTMNVTLIFLEYFGVFYIMGKPIPDFSPEWTYIGGTYCFEYFDDLERYRSFGQYPSYLQKDAPVYIKEDDTDPNIGNDGYYIFSDDMGNITKPGFINTLNPRYNLDNVRNGDILYYDPSQTPDPLIQDAGILAVKVGPNIIRISNDPSTGSGGSSNPGSSGLVEYSVRQHIFPTIEYYSPRNPTYTDEQNILSHNFNTHNINVKAFDDDKNQITVGWQIIDDNHVKIKSAYYLQNITISVVSYDPRP